jgi:hypothetical protein
MSNLSTANSSLETLPAWDGVTVVRMPPDWKSDEGVEYSIVLTERELSGEETRLYYRSATREALINPRVLTVDAIALASLFHPTFWLAVQREARISGVPSLVGRADLLVEPSSQVASARYFLQSLLFLAGVTLSAAIVQDRWSRGTIESKLTHLWRAGGMARTSSLPELDALELQDFVLEHAKFLNNPSYSLLLSLKEAFAHALEAVSVAPKMSLVTLTPLRLNSAQRDRFGFVEDLRDTLGSNLKALIVYGSSVTSETFADYDLLLVARRPAEALERMAGKYPRYRGVELNLSVYGELDFRTYQLASGDNLSDNACCLVGEVEVPQKPVPDLLARNYSFAHIRLRQQLGMAAYASAQPLQTQNDNKHNLYAYFAKVPMNIVKGTRATVGGRIDKESIADTIRSRFGYEVNEMLSWCECGRAGDALATAAWCTQRVTEMLNREHPAFKISYVEEARETQER